MKDTSIQVVLEVLERIETKVDAQQAQQEELIEKLHDQGYLSTHDRDDLLGEAEYLRDED